MTIIDLKPEQLLFTPFILYCRSFIYYYLLNRKMTQFYIYSVFDWKRLHIFLLPEAVKLSKIETMPQSSIHDTNKKKL